MTTGNEALDFYFTDNYPEFDVLPARGKDSGEILAGLLAKKDDYTLNRALVYYYNTNYDLDNVRVKDYPC